MEDRIVQHPYRYKLEPIDPEIGIYDLKPFQGQVTAVGSMYNKANVLPDDVCFLLGIEDTKTAEIKDAFTAVASGRFYGKISKISSSQRVGYGGDTSGDETVAYFSNLDSNNFNNIVADSDGYYRKIPVPAGAKRINVTISASGAKATFGNPTAKVRFYNGTTLVTSKSFSSFGSSSETTITETIQFDVEGNGEEYLDVTLLGSRAGVASDERFYTYANYLQLEVIL